MRIFRNGKHSRIDDLIDELWGMVNGNEPVGSQSYKTITRMVRWQRLIYGLITLRGVSELKVCERYLSVGSINSKTIHLMNGYGCYEIDVHTFPSDGPTIMPSVESEARKFRFRLMFTRYVQNNGRFGRRWLILRLGRHELSNN